MKPRTQIFIFYLALWWIIDATTAWSQTNTWLQFINNPNDNNSEMVVCSDNNNSGSFTCEGSVSIAYWPENCKQNCNACNLSEFVANNPPEMTGHQ